MTRQSQYLLSFRDRMCAKWWVVSRNLGTKKATRRWLFHEVSGLLLQTDFYAPTFSRAGGASGDVGWFLQLDFVFVYTGGLERVADGHGALFG